MMDVKEYQHHLAGLGYHNGSCDGFYGPVTEASIRKFQREHKDRPDGTVLWIDGIWGPATEAALRQVIATNEPPQIETPDVPDIEDGNIEKTIWNALSAQGFPAAAIAGIMGNLCAESALRPNNIEDQYQSKLGFTDETYTQAVDNGSYDNFVHDAVGYGLAQWTWHTRKKGLLSMAKGASRSIADPGIQVAFLLQELNGQYSSLVRQLKDPNINVYMATKKFMFIFEDPYDKSDAAVNGRVRLSENYYNRYA